MVRMHQPTKKIAKQPSDRSKPINYFKRHKFIIILLCIVVAITALIGVIKYNNYRNEFSDKDFAALLSNAEGVFKKVGGNDTSKKESCSYERPDVYASKHLYCRIEVGAYLPYESDEQAIRIAKDLEREITNKFGQHFYGLSDFYNNPHNSSAVTTVLLSKPFPKEQCNFYISSHEKAKEMASSLPERTDNNLIGMAFECSAESREEYFPVTYRQG